MKFVWASIALLGLLGASAPLQAAPSPTAMERTENLAAPRTVQRVDLSHLSSYANWQVAKEKKLPPDIWLDPSLQAVLKDVLGDIVFKRLYATYSESGLVGPQPYMQGSTLYILGSKPHFATSLGITIYVTMAGRSVNDVQACWYERMTNGEMVDIWFALGESPRSLPNKTCLMSEPEELLQKYGKRG